MPTLQSINNIKSKEILICRMYSDGYSSNKISNILQISTSSAKKILKKNNIKIRNSSTSHKIYTCDESIFEKINSHEKAYWIGFLQADASITSGRLVLVLSSKDISHIENFKTFIKSNHKIHLYKQLIGKNSIIKNRNKDYFYNYLGISSSKIIKDLKKYSIVPRKTFTTKFGINIPKKYINSYMAGLLDADGFITVSKNGITLGFLGNEDLAKEFQNNLIKNIPNISNNKLIKHINNKNYIVRYSGLQVFNIGKFLYKDTKFFLERKKNKILDFFKKSSF